MVWRRQRGGPAQLGRRRRRARTGVRSRGGPEKGEAARAEAAAKRQERQTAAKERRSGTERERRPRI